VKPGTSGCPLATQRRAESGWIGEPDHLARERRIERLASGTAGRRGRRPSRLGGHRVVGRGRWSVDRSVGQRRVREQRERVGIATPRLPHGGPGSELRLQVLDPEREHLAIRVPLRLRDFK
jgi:hypothetical protein